MAVEVKRVLAVEDKDGDTLRVSESRGEATLSFDVNDHRAYVDREAAAVLVDFLRDWLEGTA